MNALRKRFFINGDVTTGALDIHAKYIKPATHLLGMVKQQSAFGGLAQHQMQRTIDVHPAVQIGSFFDGEIEMSEYIVGVTLRAISSHGIDEVWINLHKEVRRGVAPPLPEPPPPPEPEVPKVEPPPPKKARRGRNTYYRQLSANAKFYDASLNTAPVCGPPTVWQPRFAYVQTIIVYKPNVLAISQDEINLLSSYGVTGGAFTTTLSGATFNVQLDTSESWTPVQHTFQVTSTEDDLCVAGVYFQGSLTSAGAAYQQDPTGFVNASYGPPWSDGGEFLRAWYRIDQEWDEQGNLIYDNFTWVSREEYEAYLAL